MIQDRSSRIRVTSAGKEPAKESGTVAASTGYTSDPTGEVDVARDSVYARQPELQANLAWLRANDPLRWMRPDGYRPFWFVAKHADVMEVARHPEVFLSEPRNQPSFEAMSYFVLIVTAGHDTTSSSIAGGLLALLENPDQLERLRRDRTLLPSAVEEFIRWTSPTRHFMRTANQDYVLRGRTIREGEDLFLSFLSANRDADNFEDPERFRIDRNPNPHLGFGYGLHYRLGALLAKLELRYIFTELLDRIEWIELAGEPTGWRRTS